MNPIRADIFAAKLEALRDGKIRMLAKQLHEDPGLIELLWFIQAESWKSGGISQFTEALLEKYPDRVGTKAMLKAGIPADGLWDLERCLSVWKDMDAGMIGYCRRGGGGAGNEFDDWALQSIGLYPTMESISRRDAEGMKLITDGLKRFNYPFFHAECLERAKVKLAEFIESLFEQWSEIQPPWYFANLIPTLFDFMRLRAQEALSGIAETEVSRLVFKRLKFAQSNNAAVMILGDARVGKTKSVSAHCNMQPGRARMVTVPDSGREWSFYAAHADAFGISYTDKTTLHVLKRAVEYTLKHSGLFIVYDESHFLLPNRFSKNTIPHRLNWVRCQIIDRGLGVAFFATRQTYHVSMKKFVSTTQHQMEQWIGRIMPPLVLPTEINPEELMAAAKASCPPMDEDLLGLIVARCISTETGFQHLVTVAKYTCFLAQERGARAPELCDVDEALAELLNCTEGKPATKPSPRQATAPASRRGRDPVAEAAPAANRISRVAIEPTADFSGIGKG